MGKTKQDTLQLVQKYSAVTLLVLFVLLNSLFTPNFFRLGNLNNIITQICPTILCGMGMTLVISTGGIDIAVGSMMALSGVLTASLMTDMGLLPSLFIAVVVAVLIGCVTGFMVGRSEEHTSELQSP